MDDEKCVSLYFHVQPRKTWSSFFRAHAEAKSAFAKCPSLKHLDLEENKQITKKCEQLQDLINDFETCKTTLISEFTLLKANHESRLKHAEVTKFLKTDVFDPQAAEQSDTAIQNLNSVIGDVQDVLKDFQSQKPPHFHSSPCFKNVWETSGSYVCGCDPRWEWK